MAQDRLTTALNEELLVLPDGKIAVLRPPIGYDLSALPREAVQISHGFIPDFNYWEASGFDVVEHPKPTKAAIVVVPRSKVLARALIAQAASLAPLVIIDGQRTDGIGSIYKDLRKQASDLPSVPKAHGRIFWLSSEKIPTDWAARPPAKVAGGYYTQAGVFSENGIDRGSEQLLKALPAKLPKRMADLGAGWGYLSAEILAEHSEIEKIDLVEAETLALQCAKLNLKDPRAVLHWADALNWKPEAKLDGIVTNPPFHTSRVADPSIGRGFIAAAAGMLTPGGHLWLVANRHLPYEAALGDYFMRVEEIGGDGAFKVFHAHRPKK